jgi:hypothetical protein
MIWMIGAGVATAGALLTKPEYALACMGTGLFFLCLAVAFPVSFAQRRNLAARALWVYLLAALAVSGFVYGLLGGIAGWPQVWTGVSGYEQAELLFRTFPPWGSFRSLVVALSGLGMYSLVALVYTTILIPTKSRKQWLLVGALFVIGVILVMAPWEILVWPAIAATPSVALTMIRVVVDVLRGMATVPAQVVGAPATILVTAVLATLAVRWGRACRYGRVISQSDLFCSALAVYTLLLSLQR